MQNGPAQIVEWFPKRDGRHIQKEAIQKGERIATGTGSSEFKNGRRVFKRPALAAVGLITNARKVG